MMEESPEKNELVLSGNAVVPEIIEETKSRLVEGAMTNDDIEVRLSKIALGEVEEDVLYSGCKIGVKKVAVKDQLKAIELLIKIRGLIVDRLVLTDKIPNIVDDIR